MSGVLRLPDGTAILGGVELRLTDEQAWETEPVLPRKARGA